MQAAEKWVNQNGHLREIESVLAKEDGDVLGYYTPEGVYFSRRVRFLPSPKPEELAPERHSLPEQWQKYEGPIYLDDMLDVEECGDEDALWRVRQNLRERAERMYHFREVREWFVPGIVTAQSCAAQVESNNQRAIVAGCPSGLTPEDWERIVADFEGRCAYCARRRPLVIEHAVPICLGGGTTIDNVVPACASCNAKKSNRDPAEWLAANPDTLICFIESVARSVEGLPD